MADPHNPATAEADADAEAYLRGSMEINEQVSTFHLFNFLTKWGSLFVVCLVLFVAVLMSTGGFGAALGSAVVIGLIGFFVLKSRKPKAH
ncbi:aa3-type cytochrome c oxidase subunit IV [Brevundimonas sp. S30B]|uniref:aa3-type cytochrome c oxidase subunit IV n=1 Tax=unclassified Brevundimonas TaxID=2622653 RepID=UPI001071ABE3|nr:MULTISPECIES: aa3-type cytochrome c oxidase subunit IV [unclassified Brevundimonas]QBX38201.1 aa3-type cytochrome c oxidase subunit IV [Brevundimonas sp. MF30-B]TFW01663.1 aa3-type cytochrome c oxidase subunit IV [Brevundimonas sp. S30B]